MSGEFYEQETFEPVPHRTNLYRITPLQEQQAYFRLENSNRGKVEAFWNGCCCPVNYIFLGEPSGRLLRINCRSILKK